MAKFALVGKSLLLSKQASGHANMLAISRLHDWSLSITESSNPLDLPTLLTYLREHLISIEGTCKWLQSFASTWCAVVNPAHPWTQIVAALEKYDPLGLPDVVVRVWDGYLEAFSERLGERSPTLLIERARFTADTQADHGETFFRAILFSESHRTDPADRLCLRLRVGLGTALYRNSAFRFALTTLEENIGVLPVVDDRTIGITYSGFLLYIARCH